jgi:Uma2 family endonuclease
MNVPQMRMDKAAFLDWAETREERCELVGGRVVMMMRPVMGHAIITRNLLVGLDRRLGRAQWTVIPDFATDVGPATLRAPDVVVVPAGADPKSRTTTSPVLLAEILSPSTATVDLGDKSSEYLALPSLAAYLVLSQDEAKAWLWLRGADGFPPGPQVIAGVEAAIAIAPLGLEVPMAEIYAGAV